MVRNCCGRLVLGFFVFVRHDCSVFACCDGLDVLVKDYMMFTFFFQLFVLVAVLKCDAFHTNITASTTAKDCCFIFVLWLPCSHFFVESNVFFNSKNYRLCKDLLLTTSVDRATRLVDKKIFQKLLIRVLPLHPDSREQPVMTD